MKNIVLSSFLLASSLVCFSQDNDVVLSYDQVSIGWIHQNDVLGLDGYDANGVGLSLSLQSGNFIGGASVMPYAEVSGDPDLFSDADLFSVGAGVGYIFEIQKSVHLVPSLSTGYFYAEAEGDLIRANSWSITPRVTTNIALNKTIELSLGIAYSNSFNESVRVDDMVFDSDYLEKFVDDDIVFFEVGLEFAVSDNVGMGISSAIQGDTQSYGLRFSYNW